MANIVKLDLAKDGKNAQFIGNTYSYKDLIKVMTGTRWDKREKAWLIPIENLEDAKRIMPTLILTPELLKTYEGVKKRLNKAVAVKAIDESKAPKTIKGLKATLFGYQAVGVQFLKTLDDQEGSILAFDMGLGKSLTGLGYFVDQLNDPNSEVEFCLVVCPSPLKYSTWEKEVRKWTDLEYQIIDGDKREKVEYEDGTKATLTGQALREVQYQQYLFGAKVLVMNYELFLRDMDIMPPIDNKWLVILDECHRIKNPRAVTTKNLVKKLRTALLAPLR